MKNNIIKAKNKLCICILVLFLAASGCAGRKAHPTEIHKPGDDARNCTSILSEMKTIEGKMLSLAPKSSKIGRNVALGVSGLILWPAWLFMDLKNAEKVEFEAYKARYEYLNKLAECKQCSKNIIQ